MKKLATLLGIFVLAISNTAYAAIAFGNSSAGTGASGTSNTLLFTNTAGNVIIAFCYRDNSTQSTWKYNGTSGTYIGSINPSTGSGGKWDTFILTSPSTGANNSVCSTTSGATFMQQWVESLTGAATTGQPDASDFTATAVSCSTLSSTIVTVAANDWVVGVGEDNNGHPTAGTGIVTLRSSETGIGSSLLDTAGLVAAGSHSYGFSGGSTGGNCGLGAVAIAPPGSAVSNIPFAWSTWW